MTARSMNSVRWPARGTSHHRFKLARGGVWCTAGLLVTLACVLLLRRLAGAFQQPLPAGGLIAAGLAVAGLAGGIRAVGHWLTKHDHAAESRRIDACGWPPMLAAGLLGLAVSGPASPTWALVFYWVTVCGGELAYWCPRVYILRHGSTRKEFSPGSNVAPAPPTDQASTASNLPTGERVAAWREEEEEGELETLPPNVFQRIIRAKAEDGGAVVYGLVRCEFAADQRQQNVHVAFCPPLAQKPHLHADQIHGPKATLKPSLIETFGACLEVRLVTPSRDPVAVQIQFYAAEQSPHERPA
ncbi:MAG: hypothetical protein NTY19_39255 [Planctomycetota bacterium]|nr:hypothetical protein [Planctomycetota bacterium]